MPKIAKDAFSGSTNANLRFTGRMNELLLINDGETPLTFTVGYFTFTLKPGEVFDEELDAFRELRITATGAYRGYVRDVD